MSGINVTGGPLKEYYFFRDTLLEKTRNGIMNFMVILPVNRAIRQFTRMLIDAAPNRVVMSPPVFTFDGLLLSVYRNGPSPGKIIDRELLNLVLAELIQAHSSEWKYFILPRRIPPGFYKRITELITELRRFGFNAEMVERSDISESGENADKLHDISFLMKKLEDTLAPDMIDDIAALNEAAALLDEPSFDSLFPGIDDVFISGYGLFTPYMYECIEKLGQWKNVHLKIEHLESNPQLFSHTRPAVERLGNYREEPSTPLSERLFNRTGRYETKIFPGREIVLYSADDRLREIEYITHKIKVLHFENNIPLNRIGITFPDLETYVPLLRQVFRDSGIPFNLSTGFRLMQSPLIRTFLNILSIHESHFETVTTLELVRSPFITTFSDLEVRRLRTFFFGRRLLHLDRSRLENLLAEMTENPGNMEELRSALEKLLRFLLPVYDFPARATISDFRDSCLKLLKHTGLLDWYRQTAVSLSERQKENEFRAYNRFMKLFERVLWMLGHIHKDTPVALKTFTDYLNFSVRDTLYNLTEWPGYGVQIMPRLEIQAIESDVLFIGGLVDGDFPRISSRDVFFSDETRTHLGLITTGTLLDQDRFLFYNLLDSRARRIILTHPRYQGEKALVRSTFVSELEEKFGILRETDAPAPLLNRLQIRDALGTELQYARFDEARNHLQTLLSFPETDTDEEKAHVLSVLSRIKGSRKRVTGIQSSEFEGYLGDREKIVQDLTGTYKNHVWSISQLERYAYCPMSFFLERVLKLEDLPELEEGLTPLERGSLIHAILFTFYTQLKQNRQAGNPQSHRDLLFQIADQAFADAPFSGFFWELEKQRYFGTTHDTGLLDTLLEKDQTYMNNSGFTPAFMEFGFGSRITGPCDPSSMPEPVALLSGENRLNLSGKIDRIDVDTSGHLAILDYKTGKTSTSLKASDLTEGKNFQLALYLLIMKQLRPEYHPVYAGIFQVSDADNCKHHPVAADRNQVTFLASKDAALIPRDPGDQEDTFDTLLETSLSMAIMKTHELISGIFRHTLSPGDSYCQSYCPFRRMCQKNVGKLRRISNENQDGSE